MCATLWLTSEVTKYFFLLLIAEYLENKNPPLNDGWTPLHSAAEEGHVDIVKYLIPHLEDKNPALDSGWTPLHSAALYGHLEIVKCLVPHLEDLNPLDENEVTPHEIARQNRHFNLEIFQYFENLNSKKRHIETDCGRASKKQRMASA